MFNENRYWVSYRHLLFMGNQLAILEEKHVMLSFYRYDLWIKFLRQVLGNSLDSGFFEGCFLK